MEITVHYVTPAGRVVLYLVTVWLEVCGPVISCFWTS